MAPPLRQRPLTVAVARLRHGSVLAAGARACLFVTIALLTLPVAFGLIGTLLPALGYMPALGASELSLKWFAALVDVPGLAASALGSLFTGLAAAGVSLAITALVMAAFAGTGIFRVLQHALAPLLAVPHAAAAFAFAFLLAPSGFLFRLAAPLADLERPPDLLVINDPLGLSLIAGLIVKEVPFLLLIALAASPQVNLAMSRRLAASLGYGRVAGFFYLVWPALYRRMRLAVYAVVAFSTSVVDVALILGPNLPGTLPTRLLAWMNDPDLSMRFLASAGAMAQLAVTASALLVWYGAEKTGAAILAFFRNRGSRFARDLPVRLATLSVFVLALSVVFAGLALLALWSIAGLWPFPDVLPRSVTWQTWQAVLPGLGAPLMTTLTAGLLSTLIALGLALGCLEHESATGHRSQSQAVLMYLPLLVPQVTFVFGLQILFLSSGWANRYAALVMTHLVFVLPYVFLSLSDAWRTLDRRYDVIASALGHTRWRVLFHVRLPLLTRPILTASAVGLAVSVGQYLPTVLIGEGRLTTITTEAVALAAGGDRRLIGAFAVLQSLVPLAGFALAALIPVLVYRGHRAMQA